MAKSERPKTERTRKTASPALAASTSSSSETPAPRTVKPRLTRRKTDQPAAIAAPAGNSANGSITIPTYAIAFRAFELYCARGGEHGHDVEDWLRAESELQAETQFQAERQLKGAVQH
jgi:hypothetical protein